MNDEQMEAMSAKLKEINERHNRKNGWRYSAVHETRKARIKRLRRWDMLPNHYPDRFIREGLELVSHRYIKGVELMVTSHKRPSMDMNVIKEFNLVASISSESAKEFAWPEVSQFNGYCRFKRKPVYERGYEGILSYAPVHGGITFACHQMGVSVYGFDTAHAGDEENPLCKNLEWVEHQALVMAESVRIAALYEPDYLRFSGRYIRAEIIDKFHAHVQRTIGQQFNLMNNFGAMINAMFGQI